LDTKNISAALIIAYGEISQTQKNTKAPMLVGLSALTNQTVVHAAMAIRMNVIGIINFMADSSFL